MLYAQNPPRPPVYDYSMHLAYEANSAFCTQSYVNPNNPYSTAAFPASSILTPISLPDSSFANARTSPVLSHHSQDYQHSFNDPTHRHHPHHHQQQHQHHHPHGLGITAAFPGDYPQAVAPGLGYPSEVMEHPARETGYSPSPQRPPKRQRRGDHRRTPSGREAPINILPDPEGLQRLQHEQQQRNQAEAQTHQRPRAPGRGRKDPQAEEEDFYVEQLREQNFAWKVVREMFRQKFHKDASEARLQMRLLRRRKERLARWDENDVSMCGLFFFFSFFFFTIIGVRV